MKDRTSTLNMDCLDYMKSLPDKAFDLIIADPPYGDCDGSWGGGKSRFEDYTGRYARYARGGEEVRRMVQSIQTAKRFGARFDRYRAGGGASVSTGGVRREVQQAGRWHLLGCCTEPRVLRRDVQSIEESNHMGWQLLRPAADKMLCRLGEAVHFGEFQHVDVRIRLDELQRHERQTVEGGATGNGAVPTLPPNAEAHRSIPLPSASLR